MTAQEVMGADAALTWEGNWHDINWAKCHTEVRKLQVRIAKAARDGRRRKVNALQWLLTHSFSGKALAVRRVTENQGRRVAGMDGVTWSTPKAKAKGILGLRRRGYRPSPLRRVHISKLNNTHRLLGIPTMRDRAIQALHLLALDPVAETTADWHSYGFRPGRVPHDATAQLFNVLSKKASAEWVLKGSIKGCFDHISHEWILKNISTDTLVLEKWLKAGFIDTKHLYPKGEGTSDGSILLPTLANMVLDGLEDRLGRRYGARKLDGGNHRVTKHKVHFIRYANDFVITGKSQELLQNEVRPLVCDFLTERGLQLSREKTIIVHISEGFDFLGYNVRKYRFRKPNEKLLIKPAKKNVKAFLAGIREVVRANRTAKQSSLIGLLNPKILDWATYHKSIVAKDTFSRADHLIWYCLWRWAKRRHPNKGSKWIHQNYFGVVEGRQHRFRCFIRGEDGQKKLVALRQACDVVIQRHVKITGSANPYNPKDQIYFNKRLTIKMESELAERRKLLYLWRRQKGLCPVCGEVITKATRWHVHHLVRRANGGSDNTSNLRLLHPDCHRQHHANPSLKWQLPVESEDLA